MVIYSNGMVRLLKSLFPNKHNNLTAKTQLRHIRKLNSSVHINHVRTGAA
ncbi:MAG: hypothetical protein U0L58_06010 [Ruminococcus sp.]|nr:hypothetical protein [Ruminococcus sp.]